MNRLKTQNWSGFCCAPAELRAGIHFTKRAENLWDMKEIHICAVSNKLAQNPTQVGNKFHFNEPRLIKSCKILGNSSAPAQGTRWKCQCRKDFSLQSRDPSPQQNSIFYPQNPSWIMDNSEQCKHQAGSSKSFPDPRFSLSKVRKYLRLTCFGLSVFPFTPFPGPGILWG